MQKLSERRKKTFREEQKNKKQKNQDKSSDIEQQSPFGDQKIKQYMYMYTASNEGAVTKPTGTSYNFDKV